LHRKTNHSKMRLEQQRWVDQERNRGVLIKGKGSEIDYTTLLNNLALQMSGAWQTGLFLQERIKT